MIPLLFIYAVGALALLGSVNKNHKKMLTGSVWSLSMMGAYLGWLMMDMFDESRGGFQMELNWAWVPKWGISLSFGIDGYSVWLILLTIIVTFSAAIMTLKWTTKSLKEHLMVIYLVQLLLIVCFCTLDAFVFLLMFESMLLPMYLWIVIWGGESRAEAGMVFLLYTLTGSVLMLVSFACMGSYLGSFSWLVWAEAPLSMEIQCWYFWAVSLAMMVKLPLFPFHTWLPLAHTQAPSSASMVLASLLLKVAGYGWLRWVLPIVPDAVANYAMTMVILSLISTVWLSFATMVQKDMKRMIAYASVNHMGWVVLGMFAAYLPGSKMKLMLIDSVSMQMFAHGLVSAGLFMGFGMIYHRTHRREMHLFGGLSGMMPTLASWFMLLSLANIGIPGSLNFVSEWMILVGVMVVKPWMAMLVGLGILSASGYTLWMYRMVFSGSMHGNQKVEDISMTESALLGILVGLLLILGFFPRPMVQGVHATSLNMQQYLFNQKIG